MILWAESFDHYGTSPNGGRDAMLSGAWASFSWGNGTAPVISTAQKRTGARSLLISYNSLATAGVQCRRVLGSTKTVVGCGFGVYFPTLPNASGKHGVEIRNASNVNILRICVESDGSIGLYSGPTLVFLGSSDPKITAAAWNFIEFKAIIDNVVGEVEVKVNGVPSAVIHMTDLDLGSVGASQLVWGNPTTGGGSQDWHVDDITTWDDQGDVNNDFLGAMRVLTIFPVSDTAEADWAKVGAASGYDCINETTPDGDSTYIASDTATELSEFGLDTLPPETSYIAGVYIPVMAKLEDAGTGNIQVSLVSGADVSEGPDQVLTAAYTYWGSVHELDPATDAPWTKSGLEAAKLRVEKTV